MLRPYAVQEIPVIISLRTKAGRCGCGVRTPGLKPSAHLQATVLRRDRVVAGEPGVKPMSEPA